MASRKVKHQKALLKREAYFAEIRRTGLEAQRKDREHRQKQAEKAERVAEKRNRRSKKKTETANIQMEYL